MTAGTPAVVEQFALNLRNMLQERTIEERKQLRKEVDEVKQALMRDQSLAPVFKAKLEEWEGVYHTELAAASASAKRLADANGDQVWVAEWVLEMAVDRRDRATRQMKKWQFLYDVARGKKNWDIALDRARDVPIGDILQTPAKIVTKKRQTYLCPLHEEDTPSFVWYVDQNRFHCFGCGKNGDVIELILRYHQVDFKEALCILAKYF